MKRSATAHTAQIEVRYALHRSLAPWSSHQHHRDLVRRRSRRVWSIVHSAHGPMPSGARARLVTRLIFSGSYSRHQEEDL
jgi:hypothetical protein